MFILIGFTASYNKNFTLVDSLEAVLDLLVQLLKQLQVLVTGWEGEGEEGEC
jgi:hypothetical protein